MQILRYIKQFFQSTWLMQRHLIYSISSAITIRMIVLVAPFKYYRYMFGTMQGNSCYCPVVSEAQLHKAVQLGRLCDRVASRLPFNGNCMMSAATFVRYARKYDIPYVMHLGVRKNIRLASANVVSSAETYRNSSIEPDQDVFDKALFAHAWVRVGPLVVTGSDGFDKFTVVASFYNPKHPPIAFSSEVL